MARKFLWGLIALLCAACSTTGDEPEPTAPEDAVRYFTITNGDTRCTLFYMGGLPIAPQGVSQPLELRGDVADYEYQWGVDGKLIEATLHIDMTGEPHGTTHNYTVVYE